MILNIAISLSWALAIGSLIAHDFFGMPLDDNAIVVYRVTSFVGLVWASLDSRKSVR